LGDQKPREGATMSAPADLVGGPVRPRDLNLEAREQAAAIEWIRIGAPQVLAFHPANGGWRSLREAARFR
jgi:hypothetical protein